MLYGNIFYRTRQRYTQTETPLSRNPECVQQLLFSHGVVHFGSRGRQSRCRTTTKAATAEVTSSAH